MSLLDYPCDIILLIADELGPKELSALMKTSRRFVPLLTKHLHIFATQDYNGLPALHYAADSGYEPLVRILLQKGFSATKTCDTYLGGSTAPIHLAAINGDPEVVRALVGAGASVSALDKSGQTPLLLAAKAGKEPVARLLIENGAIENDRRIDGHLALEQAVCHNHIPIVRLLVEKGVNVNVGGPRDATVLHMAVSNSFEPIVELLLDSGADIESRYYSEYTPLHCAVEHGRGTIVRILLARGANHDAQSMDGDTPLHRAVMWGWDFGIKLLLEKADITVRNHAGLTAIQLAKWLGNMDIFLLILTKARKDKILEKVWDITELFHYATAQGWDEIVRRLLIEGIDVNFRSEGKLTIKDRGLTALMIAAEYNCESIAKLLLEYGADTSLKDNLGVTALGRAVQQGNESIVRILLEKIDIDKDVLEDLVLHTAATSGHAEIIRLVMDRYPQINVDHRDKLGRTMLHRRLSVIQKESEGWCRRDKVFDILLGKGADINALDNNGEAPLHKAARAGAEYSRFLLSLGADPAIKSHNGDTLLSSAEPLPLRMDEAPPDFIT